MSTAWYRLDLDKTYLATPLEHKLQLLRVPFESPESKRTLSGMAALVRSLREYAGTSRIERGHITILSASPDFLARQLRSKLELDGVHVDRFVFKDQWSLIRRGRFREISDPLGYKLHALCKLGGEVDPNGDVEILVGDDYDLDPLIYSLYAELRSGNASRDIAVTLFDRHDVRPQVRDEIFRFLDGLPPADTVRAIFIRRDQRRDTAFYAAFGSRLRPYDDAFQLVLLLYDLRCVRREAVEAVVQELQQRRWRKAAFAYSWRALTVLNFLERYAEIERLLGDMDLIPRRGFFERLTRRPPRPAAHRGVNWDQVLAWRAEED
ncbi:MAG: hypothetical protein D6761_02940 [Candidatus Dadabacteria bacterium]|nr:MAG: hypothetical protein D6761_02940 [Candidatus Dadabacteria bacterium]